MSAIRLAKATIKIPKRIKRGPTDVLKALASTVNHLPTEPDALLQDDPYLMPRRPGHRNIYSLSYLNGKNAAKFLLNKHPELFFRDQAEPKVRSFQPPEQFTEDMQFDAHDLEWCIDNSDAVNGIVAYNYLINNQIKIDNELLLQFLELLCYTNEERVADHIDVKRYNQMKDSDRELVDMSWKTNGLASKIFNQIKEDVDPPRAYSIMIAGLSKFVQAADAHQLFVEFMEQHPGDGLYLNAYDGLLCTIANLNSSAESGHKAIETIVKHMEEHLVEPNLLVINSILRSYNRFFCSDETITNAFRLINDLRSLGTEPSLYTYTCVISMMGKNRNFKDSRNHTDCLLDYIQSNDQIIQVLRDPRDTDFLPTCMRVFSQQMYSINLANKLHKIYLQRPTLFKNVLARGNYLNNYYRLILSTGDLDKIVNFYNEYAPMNFRPHEESYKTLNEVLDLYR